jgi:hypothetical protein
MRAGNNLNFNVSNMYISGNHNKVTGNNNTVSGNHNTVTGHNNTILGNHNTITGRGNAWTGKFNKHIIEISEESSSSSSEEEDESSSSSSSVESSSSSSSSSSIESPQKKKSKKREDDLAFVECPLPTDVDIALPENAADNTPACVICTVNAPCCIILPCMHKSLCCECGRKLTSDGTKYSGEVKCPICQTVVHKIGKVFE